MEASKTLLRNNSSNSKIATTRKGGDKMNRQECSANVNAKDSRTMIANARSWLRTMLRYRRKRSRWPNKKSVEAVTMNATLALQVNDTTPAVLRQQPRARRETNSNHNNLQVHCAKWLPSAQRLQHLRSKTATMAPLLPRYPLLNSARL